MTRLYQRLLQHPMAEALQDTPVVLLTGPRRTGKTTLVREFEDAHRGYLTLDDLAAFSSPAMARHGTAPAMDLNTSTVG